MAAKVKTQQLIAFAILLLFGMLATIYSATTPLWEAPDEIGHMNFVLHLRQTHTLPIQRVGDLGAAHHPPLYYALAAIATLPADLNDTAGAFRPNPAFIWAGQGGKEPNASLHTTSETFPYAGVALALHLARLASVLMGLATVALVIGLGWEVFPERVEIGLLAGTLAAFNPQFLFISGAVNNDNLLVMAATGTWYQTLRALREPARWRGWALVGIWLAVAILAKASGLVIGAVVYGTLAACAFHRRSLKLFIRGMVALTVPILLLTGWWFIRNQILYGDPMGWMKFLEVYRAVLRTNPLQWNDIRHFFTTQLNSFVGLFGWMNVWAPSWFYSGIRVLRWFGLLGLGLFLMRRFRSLSGIQKGSLALCAFAVLAQEAYLMLAIQRMNESWYQGRYLFSVIGPAMFLFSLGIMEWLPKVPARLVASGLGIGLVSIAVFVPVRVIEPAYHTVPLPKWRLWFVAHPTTAYFGDQFALRGYRINTPANGTEAELTLYWQALQKPDFDYSAFVHLIDGTDRIIAQNDHAPGEEEGYPPTVWSPGDIVADKHVLTIPPESPSGVYRFRIGLYNWGTGVQVPVSSPSLRPGNFVILEKPLQLSH